MVGLMRHQAANAVHLLCAGGLRSVARGEEDGRLRQRVDGHVQQGREIGDRSAEAERERDDAHVLNRGVAEEPLDISLSPDEEGAEHGGQQPEGHEHAAGRT